MGPIYNLEDLIPFRLVVHCGLCRRGRQVDIFELMQQAGRRTGLRSVVERLSCPCGGWASHIEIIEGRVHRSDLSEKLIVERPGTCARYLLRCTPDAIVDLFGIDSRPNLPARCNFAPLQDAPVIRSVGGRRELVQMRWDFLGNKDAPLYQPPPPRTQAITTYVQHLVMGVQISASPLIEPC